MIKIPDNIILLSVKPTRLNLSHLIDKKQANAWKDKWITVLRTHTKTLGFYVDNPWDCGDFYYTPRFLR
jgi:hypothetical protein